MKNATKLPTLNGFPWLSEDLETERGQIEADFLDIAERRKELDRASAKVRSTDVSELNYADIEAADKLRQKSFQLLKDELALREQQLKPYLKRLQAEASDEQARLSSVELPEIESEIQSKLEELGYIRPIIGRSQAGEWSRNFVLQHPRHIATRNAVQELLTLSHDRTATQANDEAIKAIREQLESYRRCAVA